MPSGRVPSRCRRCVRRHAGRRRTAACCPETMSSTSARSYPSPWPHRATSSLNLAWHVQPVVADAGGARELGKACAHQFLQLGTHFIQRVAGCRMTVECSGQRHRTSLCVRSHPVEFPGGGGPGQFVDDFFALALLDASRRQAVDEFRDLLLHGSRFCWHLDAAAPGIEKGLEAGTPVQPMFETRERVRRLACGDLLRRLGLEEGARVEAEGGAHVGRVVHAAASSTPEGECQEAAGDDEHEQERLRTGCCNQYRPRPKTRGVVGRSDFAFRPAVICNCGLPAARPLRSPRELANGRL